MDMVTRMLYDVSKNPKANKQMIPASDPNPRQLKYDFKGAYSIEQAKDRVHGINSPFNKLVGQEAAKKKLGRAAVDALLQPDRCCAVTNYLVTGPSSVGKTTLVKAFAQIVDLPFVELSPLALRNLSDLLKIIPTVLKTRGLNFVPYGNRYILPPCIIFVDEAHGLKESLQHGLLKAIESQDKILHLEGGITIDCRKACWFFATTEVGELFGPLLNRFVEISLKPYVMKDIAQILKKHMDWPLVVCENIAFYERRVPRKALQLAQEVLKESNQGYSGPSHSLIREIASENDVDEYGMNGKHLKALRALQRRPVSKDRLAMMLHVRKEELERLIMPDLMIDTDDQPAYVTVSQAGYQLTDEGIEYLQNRDTGILKKWDEKNSLIINKKEKPAQPPVREETEEEESIIKGNFGNEEESDDLYSQEQEYDDGNDGKIDLDEILK